MEQTGMMAGLSKKEQLGLTREKAKLERSLGGIRDMQKVPSAVWIVDTKKEHIAVGEARKLNIPVVAILDTNCDPDEVDYKRSEEHTSELQSRQYLVCRLLLEKKKTQLPSHL